MPELAFFRRGEELLRVALADRVVIGRDPGCDVTLPDPALSRVHAVVEPRNGTWVLVDRSGRGVRVAGAEGPELSLSDGAEIALGGWRALFRVQASSALEATRTSGGGTQVRAGEARSSPPPARLRVVAAGRERTLPVTAAGVVVGKDPTCDAPIDDPFVSSRHLRIEPQGNAWAVVDLDSTNGTFISGARVARAELPLGVPVRLGDAEIVLELRDREEPARVAEFEGLLSRDPGMHQVFDLVERVAPSDAAVTIFGDTGTGKELVARALHARSARRDGPFVPVNCSAIAESLIESELFGHEKGAFSGAERMRKGAFEEADRGTIFLDEIGELPLDLQPKLLRVLELGEVKRVGASRPIAVDVRIVSATHRDLRSQVRAGRFREDLYYRLCVVPVTVPPLRQRKPDVRLLADAFLERSSPRGVVLHWSPEAMARLEGYDWPGNVRQLRNVVQRALLFRGEGLAIPAAAITFEDARVAASASGDHDTMYVRGLTLEEIEREAIRLSLRRHRGKRAAVVKELQIAKSTVMKRIGQWGLQMEGRSGALAQEAEDE